MTTPKITTFHSGGTRYYVHPGTGEKVPGVTSILNMLPKPFLKAWAAKMVATNAVEQIDVIKAMADKDADGAIDYLKRAPDRFTRSAADVGTAAHGIFEALARGDEIGRLTPDLEVYANHYRDFLDKIQPTALLLENTVWSETHSYAGSFDAFMEIQGTRAWVDNKTTRSGVHGEVALQLSAYSKADYIMDDEGEQHLLPVGNHGLVVHVRPEGWAVYEVPIGDDVFAYFLHLRQTHTWDTKVSRKVVGKPVLSGAYTGAVIL